MPQMSNRLPPLYTNFTTGGYTTTPLYGQAKAPLHKGTRPIKNTRRQTYHTKQDLTTTTTKMSKTTYSLHLYRLHKTFPQNKTSRRPLHHPIYTKQTYHATTSTTKKETTHQTRPIQRPPQKPKTITKQPTYPNMYRSKATTRHNTRPRGNKDHDNNTSRQKTPNATTK